MLRPFCNFGHLPFPMDLSIGNCRFNCDYCFARLNGRKTWQRSDYTKAFASLASQIRKAKAIQFHPDQPIDLVDFWINQGHGTVVSNNCDPFDSTNAPLYKEILGLLKAAKIPAYLLTKSARLAEFAPILGPEMAVCYATITTMDEKLAAQIEPGAPSPAKRMEDLGKVQEMGYRTECAINPWIPALSDPRQVVDAAIALGIKNFVVCPLHLSHRQKKALSPGSVFRSMESKASLPEFYELVKYIHKAKGSVTSWPLNPVPDDFWGELPQKFPCWPWNGSYTAELWEQWKPKKLAVPGAEPESKPILLDEADYIRDVIEVVGCDPLLRGSSLRKIANIKQDLPKSMNSVFTKPIYLSEFLGILGRLDKFPLQSASFFMHDKGEKESYFWPDMVIYLLDKGREVKS